MKEYVIRRKWAMAYRKKISKNHTVSLWNHFGCLKSLTFNMNLSRFKRPTLFECAKVQRRPDFHLSKRHKWVCKQGRCSSLVWSFRLIKLWQMEKLHHSEALNSINTAYKHFVFWIQKSPSDWKDLCLKAFKAKVRAVRGAVFIKNKQQSLWSYLCIHYGSSLVLFPTQSKTKGL